MSDPKEPLKEFASAYIIQDRSNQEERERLDIQDQMLTTGMGGVLPELTDPSQLRHVLDVGCGTGGWLLEAAKTYPAIENLVGADISNKMMAYAREKATADGLDKRVQFQVMDALRILEFRSSSFDLVNQRLGISWLRTWEWSKLLSEYQRVCRPHGIIRITETNTLEGNSPALLKLWHIMWEAFYHSGRLFTVNNAGLTNELVRLITQYGIRDVQTKVHSLVYRAGTQAGQHYYKDTAIGFRAALPFFQKWTSVPNDYEEIYQQALREMQQPDFVATWTLVTIWGKNPPKQERSSQTV
jgi:ubiquinone/menaquinone biosynthesis C-methylase UbiE